MTELNEKFFISTPAPSSGFLDAFPVYVAADGEPLRWSAPFPLPEIGSRIYITMNSIGWAVVKGYFSSAGFLGVMTLPTRPPKWLRDQTRRERKDGRPKLAWMNEGIGCEFGAEIALKRPKRKVAHVTPHDACEARGLPVPQEALARTSPVEASIEATEENW